MKTSEIIWTKDLSMHTVYLIMSNPVSQPQVSQRHFSLTSAATHLLIHFNLSSCLNWIRVGSRLSCVSRV